MKFKKITRIAIMMLTVACIITGCATPKNVSYFQDAADNKVITTAIVEENAIKVEPYDKLSIVVHSKDPALSRVFNLNVIANHTSQGDDGFNGGQLREYSLGVNEGIGTFTVSADGTIDYPILGIIKVQGMTRNELAAYIKGQIVGRGLIKDPVVTVEFLNVGVSILGEVNRPGRYDLNTDILTILEAISLAGDLTIQGQRENVTVLRRNGNEYETIKVDLTNTDNMLKSPAYYLKQGDVVYIEPNNIRKRQTTNNGNNIMNVSFWLSVASLLTTAAVLLK